MMVILGLSLWVLFYGLGEYLSKLWSLNPTMAGALITVICYSIGIVAWLPALREHGSLAILSTIFSLAGTLYGVAVGILIFQEPLLARHYIGISLAVLAFIFLW